jgi:hypothetical protein
MVRPWFSEKPAATGKNTALMYAMQYHMYMLHAKEVPLPTAHHLICLQHLLQV